jgi:hypothetical protein
MKVMKVLETDLHFFTLHGSIHAVDATQAASLAAGVSKPSVSRGRVLSLCAMAFNWR